MEQDSRLYSWAWVTGDQVLSHKRCELIFAYCCPSAASCNATIYNGENDQGDPIFGFVGSTKDNIPFAPPVPVYCRRGLFVDVGSNVTGILVQWRELEYKG